MELRQLKYFIEVAEALHFGKAGKNLFLSQSALSQQIKSLEDEMDVDLFSRTLRAHQRKVELTEAGKVFLVEARHILQLSEKAVERARQVGKRKNILKLGVYKMLLRERTVELVKLLTLEFPETEIKIIEFTNSTDVQEALMNETIDVGVTLLPLKFSELSARPFKKGYLNVILPSEHILAHETHLTLEQLKNEKWIEINKSIHPIFEEIEQMCREAGFNRQSLIVQEVSSLELLCGLVGLGLGIAFVPSLYDTRSMDGVVTKKLEKSDGSLLDKIELNQVIAEKKR